MPLHGCVLAPEKEAELEAESYAVDDGSEKMFEDDGDKEEEEKVRLYCK